MLIFLAEKKGMKRHKDDNEAKEIIQKAKRHQGELTKKWPFQSSLPKEIFKEIFGLVFSGGNTDYLSFRLVSVLWNEYFIDNVTRLPFGDLKGKYIPQDQLVNVIKYSNISSLSMSLALSPYCHQPRFVENVSLHVNFPKLANLDVCLDVGMSLRPESEIHPLFIQIAKLSSLDNLKIYGGEFTSAELSLISELKLQNLAFFLSQSKSQVNMQISSTITSLTSHRTTGIYFPSLPHLRELEVEGKNPNLISFCVSTTLTKLIFGRWSYCSDYSALTNLKHLVVEFVPYSMKKLLNHTTQLTCLKILECETTAPIHHLTSDSLERLIHLREISLVMKNFAYVIKDPYDAIRHLTNLEKISTNAIINHELFNGLSALTKLTCLASQNNISLLKADYVPTQIERLFLCGSSDQSDLSILSKLTRLEGLAISAPNSGFKQFTVGLASLSTLQTLEIFGYRVSEIDRLCHLSVLTSLSCLIVQQTNRALTQPEKLEKLKQCLPFVRFWSPIKLTSSVPRKN